MNQLDVFAQKHPLATGAIGVGSSLAGWLLDHIAQINAVGTLIGTALGIAIGGVTLALQLRKWRRNRSQRRHHRDQPFDDGNFDFLDRE